eukprot:3250368-Alexandrium_andersonii.AAC.1
MVQEETSNVCAELLGHLCGTAVASEWATMDHVSPPANLTAEEGRQAPPSSIALGMRRRVVGRDSGKLALKQAEDRPALGQIRQGWRGVLDAK